MNTEKDLKKLMELIGSQGFQSADEIEGFMDGLVGQSLDDLPGTADDAKSRSEDLVYEAYEQPKAQAKKTIKKALELDPYNVDAYCYLAGIEPKLELARDLFAKAVEVGELSLGATFMKENVGFFWGLIETRPYMRAKAGLADCLLAQGEIDGAIEIYEDMLELNPSDNQGIRYLLSTLLLGKDDLTSFEAFIGKSEDEDCAVWLYNKALYSFKKYGATLKSAQVLMSAYNSNNFVIDYLLGKVEMPTELPAYVGVGDESEAVSYVSGAWQIWEGSLGALDWVYHFSEANK